MVLVALRARKGQKDKNSRHHCTTLGRTASGQLHFAFHMALFANIYLISKSESEVKKRQSTNTTNKHKPRKKTVAYLQFFRLVP